MEAEPTLDMLATAGGLAGVVFLIMSVLRGVVDASIFDRWGAVIAIVVATVLALVYMVATINPFTLVDIIQAFLVGLFGGVLSQNVNAAVKRAVGT